MKSKLYFFVFIMTFCFGKATFDVNVNVGASSLSNVKTSITNRTDLKTPEWKYKQSAGASVELLRDKSQSQATILLVPNENLWSKDDINWIGVNTHGETDAEAYEKYVTSVAKDYALENPYERHHYDYRSDATKNLHQGGFAAGLSLGVKYELNQCFKIGARAFFTATDLKRDLGYKIVPMDKDDHEAINTKNWNREVQMLIGYADAHGSEKGLGATQYVDGIKIVDNGNVDKNFSITIAGTTEKTNADNEASAMAFYALNINRNGLEAIKGASQSGTNYEIKLTDTVYDKINGIVLTKVGIASKNALLQQAAVEKVVMVLIKNTNVINYEVLRNRNYSLTCNDLTIPAANVTAINTFDGTLKGSNFVSRAVNITGVRASRADNMHEYGLALNNNIEGGIAEYIDGFAAASAGDGRIKTTADTPDKLVLSEAKYNEIIKAFDEMSEDFDVKTIDQTLKVKNVWGAMATLSWNVTDCTMFTFGAGIGVPTVSKIDNLKRKIGFAGMFEISTKVAEYLSFGVKYQFNRIKVKDANSATHHISKVNGNLHIFSANLTYSF